MAFAMPNEGPEPGESCGRRNRRRPLSDEGRRTLRYRSNERALRTLTAAAVRSMFTQRMRWCLGRELWDWLSSDATDEETLRNQRQAAAGPLDLDDLLSLTLEEQEQHALLLMCHYLLAGSDPVRCASALPAIAAIMARLDAADAGKDEAIRAGDEARRAWRALCAETLSQEQTVGGAALERRGE